MIISIPRYHSLKKIVVKNIAGINNLFGNFPFSLIVLWYLMRIFGYDIARVTSNCLVIVLHKLTNTSSLLKLIRLLLQTGKSPLGGELSQTPLWCGWITTACSPQFGQLEWSWFLSVGRQTDTDFSVSERFRGFLLFLCSEVQNINVRRPPWGG